MIACLTNNKIDKYKMDKKDAKGFIILKMIPWCIFFFNYPQYIYLFLF